MRFAPLLCESLLARKLSCLLLQPSNHHHRSSFSTRLLSRAFLLIPLVRVSLLSPSHCQLFHLSILHPSQSLRKIFHYKHLPHCFSLISSIASINLHPFHNHYPAPSDHWALHSVAASCHFGACYLPTLKLQSTTLLPYYYHQSINQSINQVCCLLSFRSLLSCFHSPLLPSHLSSFTSVANNTFHCLYKPFPLPPPTTSSTNHSTPHLPSSFFNIFNNHLPSSSSIITSSTPHTNTPLQQSTDDLRASVKARSSLNNYNSRCSAAPSATPSVRASPVAPHPPLNLLLIFRLPALMVIATPFQPVPPLR